MAFSDDAIGFFLQLDDQLTPALATAGGSYKSFIKSLDTYNKQAFKSVNAGMSALTELVESFERLPKTAAKAYAKAVEAVKKKIKPLTQKIGLEFGPQATKSVGAAIKKAVASALSKVKIRLSATVPMKRSKFFDTSVPMRAFYKTQPTPPDMVGRFQNLPRFAEGGEVMAKGSKKGVDDILALLREGEIVLPKDVSKILKDITKRKALPKGLTASIVSVGRLGKELEDLRDAIDLGLDPAAPMKFKKGLEDMRKEFATLIHGSKGMKKGLDKIIPLLKTAKDRVEQFKDEGKDAQPVYEKLLGKILGAQRFQVLHKAFGTLRESLLGLTTAAGDTFTTLEGDQIEGLITNINQMNQFWNLTRAELRQVKLDAHAAAAELEGVTSAEFGEAMEELTQRGFDHKAALQYAKSVAAITVATDASADSTADFFELATKVGALTQQQADDLARTIQLQTKASNNTITFGQALQQATSQAQDLGQVFFEQFGPEQQAQILKGFSTIATTLPKGYENMSEDIQKIFSGAMQQTEEGMVLASRAFGLSVDEVRDKMAKGEIDVLIAGLTDKLGNMSEFTANTFAEMAQLGASGAELRALNLALERGEGNLEAVSMQSAAAGTGMAAFTKQADQNKTVFQKLTMSISDGIGSMQVFGVSGAEVMDFFKEFNPQVALVILQLVGMTAGLAANTIAWVFNNAATIKAVAGWVISQGVMIAIRAATIAWTAAQWLLNVAMNANPIGLITVGIIALVLGIGLLVKHWDKVKSAFVMTFKTIKGWVMSAIDWIAGFGDKLLFLLGPIGAIIFAIQNFGAVWDFIKEKAMSFFAFLGGGVEGLGIIWDTIKEKIGGIVSFLTEGVSAGIEGIKGIFAGIVAALRAPIELLKGFINQWIIGPLNQILNLDLPITDATPGSIIGLSSIPFLEAGGRVETTGAAIIHRGEFIIPEDKIAQILPRMLLGKAEIDKAILVKMDPDATDKPVLDAIEEQTNVLREVLSAIAAGRPIVVPALASGGGGGRRGAGSITQGMGAGDY